MERTSDRVETNHCHLHQQQHCAQRGPWTRIGVQCLSPCRKNKGTTEPHCNHETNEGPPLLSSSCSAPTEERKHIDRCLSACLSISRITQIISYSPSLSHYIVCLFVCLLVRWLVYWLACLLVVGVTRSLARTVGQSVSRYQSDRVGRSIKFVCLFVSDGSEWQGTTKTEKPAIRPSNQPTIQFAVGMTKSAVSSVQ